MLCFDGFEACPHRITLVEFNTPDQYIKTIVCILVAINNVNSVNTVIASFSC